MAREVDALWEEALQQEEDVDRLADQIVAEAVRWAGGSAKELKRAERMLARTPYLGSSTCPRCGMRMDDPRHEVLTDGCRAHVIYGETAAEFSGEPCEEES